MKFIIISGDNLLDITETKLKNDLNVQNFDLVKFPENSKHPRDQVEFVRSMMHTNHDKDILVILTHSPFIIQAFRFIGEEMHLVHNISFLLHENNRFHNVDTELGRMFDNLLEVLQDIPV